MCNLYSMTKSREALVAYTRAMRDRTANQPPLPGIFPDQMAPVVGTSKEGLREVVMMRWGFPPAGGGKRPVTNIRNYSSPYWRGWLEQPRFRCVVPATSFCEYTDSAPKVAHWFALGDERPLFCFAGVWRPWSGVRGKEEGTHLLFAFLTTDANDLVAPIHAKAMPVMLTGEEIDTWLEAPADEALSLARPFAADRMKIVLSGPKEDPGETLT
ncbi:MAG TPA: SOS response-associated peptidase [Vitreimonas sp.]|uniref:SOS response-associated peptidase n=1 Tax=Vitreimonas sp. TaxID=3069702 RepID=UPI002D2DE126|nr:SOS response-associated peptidase [Vitreimonas sp.]HYD88376.1 SOS response-associated peptidase [Vitreimonas sp.]